MSDSILKTPSSNKSSSKGATQVKVAPIPPERYRNGTANGHANSVNAPKNGAHIPINLKAISDSDSESAKMMNRAFASIPDVMADEEPLNPVEETVVAETVQQQVNRLRPKTLMMQLRFLYTLLFALWLFGRLIFWQVYVAKLFPEWVANRNNKRWKQYAGEFRKFALRMGGVQIKAGNLPVPVLMFSPKRSLRN